MPEHPSILGYDPAGAPPADREWWSFSKFLIGIFLALCIAGSGCFAAWESATDERAILLLMAMATLMFLLGLVLRQIRSTRSMGEGILAITVLAAITLIVLSER